MKLKEVDARQIKRVKAFELWMNAPMPMVTLFKTLEITKFVKLGHKHRYKFNMLMWWCIGKAASQTEEFYLLPVGKKLMQYDSIAVNTVVLTKEGDINTCDIPFSVNLRRFNQDYLKLTSHVHNTCQFHHTQMDGAHAAQFLERLQKEI